MEDWLLSMLPYALGGANLFVTLYVQLSISRLETRISEARRKDRKEVEEWVERRFQRRPEVTAGLGR